MDKKDKKKSRTYWEILLFYHFTRRRWPIQKSLSYIQVSYNWNRY